MHILANGIKYFPYPYTIWFSATEVTVSHGLDKETSQHLAISVSGKVTVEGYGIGVIGRSGTRQKALELNIHERSPDDIDKSVDGNYGDASMDEEGRRAESEIPAVVALGFFGGDSETRNYAAWWVHIALHRSAITEIANIISQNRVETMTFGVRFSDVYTDDEYGPVNSPKEFGVKAAGEHSSETVEGALALMRFSETTTSLLKEEVLADRIVPDKNGSLDTNQTDDTNKEPATQALSESLNQLTSSVSEIGMKIIRETSQIKWILGVLIVIAAILIRRI